MRSLQYSHHLSALFGPNGQRFAKNEVVGQVLVEPPTRVWCWRQLRGDDAVVGFVAGEFEINRRLGVMVIAVEVAPPCFVPLVAQRAVEALEHGCSKLPTKVSRLNTSPSRPWVTARLSARKSRSQRRDWCTLMMRSFSPATRISSSAWLTVRHMGFSTTGGSTAGRVVGDEIGEVDLGCIEASGRGVDGCGEAETFGLGAGQAVHVAHAAKGAVAHDGDAEVGGVLGGGRIEEAAHEGADHGVGHGGVEVGGADGDDPARAQRTHTNDRLMLETDAGGGSDGGSAVHGGQRPQRGGEGDLTFETGGLGPVGEGDEPLAVASVGRDGDPGQRRGLLVTRKGDDEDGSAGFGVSGELGNSIGTDPGPVEDFCGRSGNREHRTKLVGRLLAGLTLRYLVAATFISCSGHLTAQFPLVGSLALRSGLALGLFFSAATSPTCSARSGWSREAVERS